MGDVDPAVEEMRSKPMEERVAHKNWKVRVSVFEDMVVYCNR